MVVEMGTHMLRSVPGMHLLVQLLPPGLEERARALPPLISTYSTPGNPWQQCAWCWAPAKYLTSNLSDFKCSADACCMTAAHLCIAWRNWLRRVG